MGKIARAAGACGVAMALFGCAGQKPEADPNSYPADYKTTLLEFLRGYVADPSGIRNAFLAPPALKPFKADSRYLACVRYDAKDADGQYVGARDFVAIFFAGNLNQFLPAEPDQCKGAAYQPFPELQELKRPGKK